MDSRVEAEVLKLQGKVTRLNDQEFQTSRLLNSIVAEKNTTISEIARLLNNNTVEDAISTALGYKSDNNGGNNVH